MRRKWFRTVFRDLATGEVYTLIQEHVFFMRCKTHILLCVASKKSILLQICSRCERGSEKEPKSAQAATLAKVKPRLQQKPWRPAQEFKTGNPNLVARLSEPDAIKVRLKEVTVRWWFHEFLPQVGISLIFFKWVETTYWVRHGWSRGILLCLSTGSDGLHHLRSSSRGLDWCNKPLGALP